MGTYVYIGRDRDGSAELRKKVRERHLAALEQLDRDGRILFAGPLRDEGGDPCGSVVVLEADDLASARALAESDPYVSEGIFERVDVHESMQVFPRKDR